MRKIIRNSFFWNYPLKFRFHAISFLKDQKKNTPHNFQEKQLEFSFQFKDVKELEEYFIERKNYISVIDHNAELNFLLNRYKEIFNEQTEKEKIISYTSIVTYFEDIIPVVIFDEKIDSEYSMPSKTFENLISFIDLGIKNNILNFSEPNLLALKTKKIVYSLKFLKYLLKTSFYHSNNNILNIILNKIEEKNMNLFDIEIILLILKNEGLEKSVKNKFFNFLSKDENEKKKILNANINNMCEFIIIACKNNIFHGKGSKFVVIKIFNYMKTNKNWIEDKELIIETIFSIIQSIKGISEFIFFLIEDFHTKKLILKKEQFDTIILILKEIFNQENYHNLRWKICEFVKIILHKYKEFITKEKELRIMLYFELNRLDKKEIIQYFENSPLKIMNSFSKEELVNFSMKNFYFKRLLLNIFNEIEFQEFLSSEYRRKFCAILVSIKHSRIFELCDLILELDSEIKEEKEVLSVLAYVYKYGNEKIKERILKDIMENGKNENFKIELYNYDLFSEKLDNNSQTLREEKKIRQIDNEDKAKTNFIQSLYLAINYSEFNVLPYSKEKISSYIQNSLSIFTLRELCELYYLLPKVEISNINDISLIKDEIHRKSSFLTSHEIEILTKGMNENYKYCKKENPQFVNLICKILLHNIRNPSYVLATLNFLTFSSKSKILYEDKEYFLVLLKSLQNRDRMLELNDILKILHLSLFSGNVIGYEKRVLEKN